MSFRTRSRSWSICIGPGVTLGAGPAGGVNLYKLANEQTGEIFKFAHLVMGAGASANLSGIKALGGALRSMLGNFEDLFTGGQNLDASVSSDYVPLTVHNAFSAYDVDWSSASFNSLSGGLGLGGGASLMHGYGRSWSGLDYRTRDFYTLRKSGSEAQLGVNVFHGGGPMVTVGLY